MDWITKKNLIIVSFLLGSLAFFFGYISDANKCFLAYKQCESVAFPLLIFVPVFFLSIIFFFTEESTFFSWKKFLTWWIPISLVLITLAPLSPVDFSPIYKKTVFWFMGVGMVVISFVLIFFNSLKNKIKVK